MGDREEKGTREEKGDYEEEGSEYIVECQPYQWIEKDRVTDEEEAHLCIDIWCLNKESQPILLRIENFPCLCMLELPVYVDGVYKNWNPSECDILMNDIAYLFRDKMGYSCGPYKYVFKNLGKLYYYRGERKYPFIQLFFGNMKNRNIFKQKLAGPVSTKSFGSIQMRIWETDVTNVRKLQTAKQLQVCQWIRVKGKVPIDKLSIIQKEYLVDYRDIIPIDPTITSTWHTYPKIAVFDFECFSHRPNSFPDPLAVRDATFMASVICGRYMNGGLKKDGRIKYCVVYGDCEDIPDDKIQGAVLILVKSEKELYRKFGEIIKEYDPEIRSGFNINKFDVSYLKDRLEILDIDIFNSSRIPSEPTKIHTSEWESRAFGLVSASTIEDQGRMTFDLFPYCERSMKLVRYNLDTIAKEILNDEKDDVDAKFMFATFAKQRELKKKGLQNTPEYEQTKRDMTKIAEYCIKDSVLVFDILEKITIWIGLLEYANASAINIEDLYTRGQQISSFSLIYNRAAMTGIVVNHIDVKNMNMSGGFVREPIKGLHSNVITLDFTSLYPSIMISENLDYTTLVPDNMYDIIPDDQCNVHEFEQEEKFEVVDEYGNKKKTKEIRKYRFKFYKNKKGIIPWVLEDLLSKRSAAKKLLAAEKDPTLKSIYNQRQLALKVRANSLFGFTGAHDGRLPCIPIAATVTAVGRKHISRVDNYVMEHHNARVVYNDTDSSFIQLAHVPTSELESYGKNLAAEVSKLFPDPVNMEYEKACKVLCLKKKKYAGLPYLENGELDTRLEKMTHKGIMSARRDNPQFSREIYIDILYNSILEADIYDIMTKVYKASLDLIEGKINSHELEIVKKVGAVYKNDNFAMKRFADRLKTLGKPVEPGDRIPYLVSKSDAHYLGDKYITPEMLREEPDKYKIDYAYYLEKCMASHIDQVIQIVYGKELLDTGISFKANNRCKAINFDTPIGYMCKMMKYGVEIRELDEIMEYLREVCEEKKEKKVFLSEKKRVKREKKKKVVVIVEDEE